MTDPRGCHLNAPQPQPEGFWHTRSMGSAGLLGCPLLLGPSVAVSGLAQAAPGDSDCALCSFLQM